MKSHARISVRDFFRFCEEAFASAYLEAQVGENPRQPEELGLR
jgi:hypothetical protein